jgi:hypothetical protein
VDDVSGSDGGVDLEVGGEEEVGEVAKGDTAALVIDAEKAGGGHGYG